MVEFSNSGVETGIDGEGCWYAKILRQQLMLLDGTMNDMQFCAGSMQQ